MTPEETKNFIEWIQSKGVEIRDGVVTSKESDLATDRIIELLNKVVENTSIPEEPAEPAGGEHED